MIKITLDELREQPKGTVFMYEKSIRMKLTDAEHWRYEEDLIMSDDDSEVISGDDDYDEDAEFYLFTKNELAHMRSFISKGVNDCEA